MQYRETWRFQLLGGVCLLVWAGACSSGTSGQGTQSTGPNAAFSLPEANVDYAAGDFFEDDPEAPYCGPGGQQQANPEPPGGTPECPDDKRLEGCPCDQVGETASCWPGPRQYRDRGVCQSGTTTCQSTGEFTGTWGPCEGAALPGNGATPTAQDFASQCSCFSAGTWSLASTLPCFYLTNGQLTDVTSGVLQNGQVTCLPHNASIQGQTWSTSTLRADCAGSFQLCATLKAGSFSAPAAQDCTLSSSCIDVWYPDAGVEIEAPALPAWRVSNLACAKQFQSQGGYIEYSVKGLSTACEPVGEGAADTARVFQRTPYCAAHCADTPSAPECLDCTYAGGGQF